MSGHQAADLSRDVLVVGDRATRWALAAGAVGLLGLGGAAGVGLAGPAGVAPVLRAYLVAFSFFLSLALGALFFTMVQYLTRAGWSVVVRRVAEVTLSTLPPLAVLALPVLLGLDEVFPWVHPHGPHAEAVRAKGAYLNVPFFTARAVLYFLVWCALARRFASASARQDESGEPGITVGLERLAAAGMPLFALTVTFFAFDWLMSLTPSWYSTIFGVYFFAGAAVGFFALLPVATAVLQRLGYVRRAVTLEHYHDMGKLVFAFVVFWAYIAFSQYMLIWYANLPEETVWYRARQIDGWERLSLLLLAGHFLVPFVAILSRFPKRRPKVLVPVALWVLLMHAADLFWLVGPEDGGAGLSPLALVLCFAGVGGVFTAAAAWKLRKVRLIPVRDPRLEESLGFENV